MMLTAEIKRSRREVLRVNLIFSFLCGKKNAYSFIKLYQNWHLSYKGILVHLCIQQSNMHKLLLYTIFFVLAVAANAQKEPLFTLLNEKQTGINFTNSIKEDDSLNVF